MRREKMSDESGDDEAVPPTPPRETKRITVALFRRREIVEEQEEFDSSSDSCDDQKSLALIMQNRNSVAPERESRGVKRKQRDIIYISDSSSNDDKSSIEPKRKTRESIKEKNTEKTINPKKKKKNNPVTRSKPRRVRESMKCDECGVTTKNIWRHMINTHNKNYTKRENDAVTSGGYITYICPAPKKGAPSRKCGKVEKRLTDHLARSHKIKRGSKRMKTMLARADAVIKETVVEPEDDSDFRK
ncbi:unnamed protein product [Mytilus coruscus]|uniref:Uncharacterized protein n=1 Tax=Mytilus coruscus TaxID=42192 RepID=A0A6J8CRH2_MYTCO|nr:unnamed protein product [Mytilus coruscus]